jgi:hypothetical protein
MKKPTILSPWLDSASETYVGPSLGDAPRTRLKPAKDGTPGLTALKKRFAMMKAERDKFTPKWRRISDLVVPYRGRFDENEPNQATNEDRYLIDPTPTRALETLQAGMQSGLTSPSRPWFKLQVADPELAARPSSQRWMDDVRDRMLAIIARSNFYGCFYDLYGEVAAFGTGALILEEHETEVIHGTVLTAGEYCVSFDALSEPSAFGRVVWMTAEQMASRFGVERLSSAARNSLNQNRPGDWYMVNHIIVPDKDRNTRFPYMSVYWEDGAGAVVGYGGAGAFGGGTDTELLIGGHEEFPVLCPRWHTVGNDTYGYGPGHLAASEASTLHEQMADMLIADKKLIDPPMMAPESARSFGYDSGPGYINYTPADAGLRPLYQINFDIAAHMAAVQDSRNFINQLFFADLFLMIASLDQNAKMTATEAQIRKEEKLQMLGPVTERLTHELLDPAITRTFKSAFRRGEFPRPPDELLGAPIRIEYISILAMAQIAGSIADMQVFMEAFGGMAQLAPEVLDKFNGDETADQLVKMSNVPAAIIRSDDEVAAIRQQRAAQEEQMRQMAQMQAEAQAMKQGSSAVKDLATAPAGEGSALASIGEAMNG